MNNRPTSGWDSDLDLPRAEEQPRGRTLARRLGWATAGAVALGISYFPAARVPIIADDLMALQETYAVSNGNLWQAIVFGVTEGTEGGHFNPAGQALGATFHFAAYAVSASLEVSPQYFDVLTYLAMMLLTVGGATSVLVWGLSRSSHGRPDFWPLFALMCAITAATLQIHTPWSNDPVVSFGPAGWGSAAIGFWTIATALRATSPGASGRGSLVGCSLLAITCVWYYEMLVSAVAATAVALVLTATLAADRQAVRRRCLLLLGTAVALPALLFVLGRALAAPMGPTSYGGTTVALGPAALETWWFGMVGSLPAGGWTYLIGMTGPPVLRRDVLLVGGALCVVVGAIGVAWARAAGAQSRRLEGIRPRRGYAVALLASVIITFWALATASHSIAVKYIQEIRNPGQVYLFYAVSVVAVAMLVALALVTLRGRAHGRLLLGLLPVAGAFVLAQVSVNVALAETTRGMVPNNASLVELSTDGDADPAVRCAVLEAWVAQGWPEYYSTPITEDLQENYQRVFDEPFCEEPGTGSP